MARSMNSVREGVVMLPPSPNWFFGGVADATKAGVFGFCAKNAVYLLDVTRTVPAVTGCLLCACARVTGCVFSLTPGQDRLCVTSGDNGVVQVWDTDSLTCLHTQEQHRVRPTDLQQVWYRCGTQTLSPAFILRNNTGYVLQIYNRCDTGVVQVWDTDSLTCLHTQEQHRVRPTDLQQVWYRCGTQTLSPAFILRNNTGYVLQIYNRCGTGVGHRLSHLPSYSGTTQGTSYRFTTGVVQVWDTDSLTCLHTQEQHREQHRVRPTDLQQVWYRCGTQTLSPAFILRNNTGYVLQIYNRCDTGTTRGTSYRFTTGVVQVWYRCGIQTLSPAIILGNNTGYVLQIYNRCGTGVIQVWYRCDTGVGYRLSDLPSYSGTTQGTSYRFTTGVVQVWYKCGTDVQSPVTALVWYPVEENTVVTADQDGYMVKWQFQTGEVQTFQPDPNSHIVSLACSPHQPHILAAGLKSGPVVLLELQGEGRTVCRLQGHTEDVQSVVWMAADDDNDDNGTSNDESIADKGPGQLLASGSKDGTIRVWSSRTGSCVCTLKLPASGDMLVWDLRTQKWQVLEHSEGQGHSRVVFSITAVHNQVITTSMDRQEPRAFGTRWSLTHWEEPRPLPIQNPGYRHIILWDLSSMKAQWSLPTLGGFVYALAFSPLTPGQLAVGVGDGMIRVWNTHSQAPFDWSGFWQCIKGKVTAIQNLPPNTS
ncbi:Gem-associated protein 5 [Branchiostoma belcheri]|nr:Gem-associated protein 5 [Branchiostoma belcheri]